MHRFFFSLFATETNSFSNIPTTLASFDVCEGEEIFSSGPCADLRARLTASGIDVVGGLSAYAEPAAPIQQSAYEALRDRLLHKLKQAMPVDAVLLHLHGAMVSQDCDDCEGDILRRVRALVGTAVPIGAMLDPHAHLSRTMVGEADILAFMKEYPHTDGMERSDAVVRVLLSMLRDGLRPVPAMLDCHMQGFFPTQTEPMRSFVDRLRALEGTPGILDISFVHGFPFGDTSDTGAKLLIYDEYDGTRAAHLAQDLYVELWSMRREAMLSLATLDEALAMMRAPGPRPLVVADFADNPGGGAPSDNVTILSAVVASGLTRVAFGMIYDPQAVRLCHQVGVGGRLELRIGGKTGKASGQPIDLAVEVMGLARDAYTGSPNGVSYPLGDTALVRHAGIDIALSSCRMQLSHPSALTHLGADPASYDTIVVKSSNHFAAGFADIGRRFIHASVDGALQTDLARIAYSKLIQPWYPRDAGPFASAAEVIRTRFSCIFSPGI